MKFGIVGLGKMGAGLARRAVERGHDVVGWDPDEAARDDAVDDGVEPVATIEKLVKAIEPPRVILVYVPQGDPVDEVCRELHGWVAIGDVVADGGNSHWEESRRRAELLSEVDAHFLDVGTSGGIPSTPGWQGAAFMVGGDPDGFAAVEPLLRDLAVDPDAVFHAGPSGTGHFVKLVHNAIEFGMIQAIAEGVELLERAELDLDLADLFRHWTHGTVIRGWLLDLMADALEQRPDPGLLSTYVEDTGEVKWVLDWALRNDVPTPVVAGAQQALMSYRDLEWPAAKAVALLRHAFGGHPVHRVAEPEAAGDLGGDAEAGSGDVEQAEG